MIPDEKLTAKQQAFVREYLIDMNGKQAAIRAGYSARTADRIAYQLLERPCVAAKVQKLMDERAARTEIDADRTLKELVKLGFSDIRSVFDERGRLRPIHTLPPEITAAIASVKVVTKTIGSGEDMEVEYVHEIKLWDKNSAFEKIAKHLGMFTERVEVAGDEANPLAVLIKQIQGSAIRPVTRPALTLVQTED